MTEQGHNEDLPLEETNAEAVTGGMSGQPVGESPEEKLVREATGKLGSASGALNGLKTQKGTPVRD